MKINIGKIFISSIALFLFLFSSCREDIIPPNNPSSNLNQPVRLISSGSYTFILNAHNVSSTYNDYSGLNGTHSLIHLTLVDYKNGTVILHIYNNSQQLIFQKAMAIDIDEFSEYLDNENPATFQIIFNNFSGNLKIVVDNW